MGDETSDMLDNTVLDNQGSGLEGLWYISSRMNPALYSGTFYGFDADGTLRFLSGEQDLEPTGVVVGNDGVLEVLCTFASKWSPVGEGEMSVATTCDDGVARTVRLVEQQVGDLMSDGVRGVDMIPELEGFTVEQTSYPDGSRRYVQCGPVDPSLSANTPCEYSRPD